MRRSPFFPKPRRGGSRFDRAQICCRPFSTYPESWIGAPALTSQRHLEGVVFQACFSLVVSDRQRSGHEPRRVFCAVGSMPELAGLVYQTRGIRRFVRAAYAAYSAPNCWAIILSSSPIRRAKRTANAIKFDSPATQFGITRAWPTA